MPLGGTKPVLSRLEAFTRVATSDIRVRRAAIVAFVLAVALYSANAFGVLRLNNDVITLLGLSLSGFEGHGRISQGQTTVFPPGYPILVKLLLLTDLASTAALVLTNFLLLLSAIAAFYFLGRQCFPQIPPVVMSAISGLSVVNWIIVKHAPLAMTDVPFFGLAMLSLLTMELARRTATVPRTLLLFTAAVSLVFCAISFRRTGIVLVPPLFVAAVFWQGGHWLSNRQPLWLKLSAIVLVATSVLGLTYWWYLTSTLVDLPEVNSVAEKFSQILKSLKFHVVELLQVLINFPASKIPFMDGILGLAMGATLAGLLIVGVARQGWPGVCETFFLGYGAILALWPHNDPRFLLPIIPLILTYAYLGFTSLLNSRWAIAALLLWAFVYLTGGAVALAYSARITLAIESFPQVYGDGTFRETYCAHLQSCGEFDPSRVNATALSILRAFEPDR